MRCRDRDPKHRRDVRDAHEILESHERRPYADEVRLSCRYRRCLIHSIEVYQFSGRRRVLALRLGVVIVYAVVSEMTSPTSPLGDAIETFVRREDAERFLEDVRRDDHELASHLRIEERELEGGGSN